MSYVIVLLSKNNSGKRKMQLKIFRKKDKIHLKSTNPSVRDSRETVLVRAQAHLYLL